MTRRVLLALAALWLPTAAHAIDSIESLHTRPNGTTEIHVVWDAVSGATDYQYRVDAGSWTDVPGDSTRVVVTSLAANTDYDFQVRAWDAVPDTTTSSTVSGQTFEAPIEGWGVHGGIPLGGLYADLVEVTNTNNSGTGSFSNAISNAYSAGGGYVQFTIGGTFPINGFDVFGSELTLDGYSAPELVVIDPPSGNGPIFGGHGSIPLSNTFVRGLAFYDAVIVAALESDSGTPSANIVFDHNAFLRNQGEKCMGIGYGSRLVTFQYNVVGGNWSYEQPIPSWTSSKNFDIGFGLGDNLDSLTVHKNMIFRGRGRNPQIQGTHTDSYFGNNIIGYSGPGYAMRRQIISADTGPQAPGDPGVYTVGLDIYGNLLVQQATGGEPGSGEAGNQYVGAALSLQNRGEENLWADENYHWLGALAQEIPATATSRTSPVLSTEHTNTVAQFQSWVAHVGPQVPNGTFTHLASLMAEFDAVWADSSARAQWLDDVTLPTNPTTMAVNEVTETFFRANFNGSLDDHTAQDDLYHRWKWGTDPVTAQDSTQYVSDRQFDTRQHDSSERYNGITVQPGTTYYVWAKVADLNGNEASGWAGPWTVTTLGGSDGVPPTWDDDTPTLSQGLGSDLVVDGASYLANDETTPVGSLEYRAFYATGAVSTSSDSTSWQTGNGDITITGLAGTTAYNVAVQARDQAGNVSTLSQVVNETTGAATTTVLPITDGAPTACTTTAAPAPLSGTTDTSIRWGWNKSCTVWNEQQAGRTAGYELRYWPVPAGPGDTTTVSDLTNDNYTATGLSSGTTYQSYVYAWVGSPKTYSLVSNTSDAGHPGATTTGSSGSAPDPPTDLAISNTTPYTISVAWTPTPGDTTRVIWDDDSNPAAAIDSVVVAGTGPQVYQLTGVNPVETYYFWARSVDDGSISVLSASVNGTTDAPPAPSGFTVSSSDGHAFMVWGIVQPGVGDGITYEIDETTGGPGATDATGLAGEQYTDTGLTNGTEYTYRARASRNGTPGPWTASQSTTPSAPVAAAFDFVYEYSAVVEGLTPIGSTPDSAYLVIQFEDVENQEFAVVDTIYEADMTAVANVIRYVHLTDSLGVWKGDMYTSDGTSWKAAPVVPIGRASLSDDEPALLDVMDDRSPLAEQVTNNGEILTEIYALMDQLVALNDPSAGEVADATADALALDPDFLAGVSVSVADRIASEHGDGAYTTGPTEAGTIAAHLASDGEFLEAVAEEVATNPKFRNNWALASGGMAESMTTTQSAATSADNDLSDGVDLSVAAAGDIAAQFGDLKVYSLENVGITDAEELDQSTLFAPLNLLASGMNTARLAALEGGTAVFDSGRVVNTAINLTEEITAEATLDSAAIAQIAASVAATTPGAGDARAVLAVKSSADSSAVQGARVLVQTSDRATTLVWATSSTTGYAAALVDSVNVGLGHSGVYAYSIASDQYDVAEGTFTVESSPDTTTVYLSPLATPTPTDPDAVTLVVDILDADRAALGNPSNVLVKATINGQRARTSSQFIGYRTVQALSSNGRATLQLLKSSVLGTVDTDSTYTISFEDKDATRNAAGNPILISPVRRVVIPDSSAATPDWPEVNLTDIAP